MDSEQVEILKKEEKRKIYIQTFIMKFQKKKREI